MWTAHHTGRSDLKAAGQVGASRHAAAADGVVGRHAARDHGDDGVLAQRLLQPPQRVQPPPPSAGRLHGYGRDGESGRPGSASVRCMPGPAMAEGPAPRIQLPWPAAHLEAAEGVGHGLRGRPAGLRAARAERRLRLPPHLRITAGLCIPPRLTLPCAGTCWHVTCGMPPSLKLLEHPQQTQLATKRKQAPSVLCRTALQTLAVNGESDAEQRHMSSRTCASASGRCVSS